MVYIKISRKRLPLDQKNKGRSHFITEAVVGIQKAMERPTSTCSEASTYCSQGQLLWQGEKRPLRRSQRLMRQCNAEMSSSQLYQIPIDDSSKYKASIEYPINQISNKCEQANHHGYTKVMTQAERKTRRGSKRQLQETETNLISGEQRSNPLDLRTKAKISKLSCANSSQANSGIEFAFHPAPIINSDLGWNVPIKPKPLPSIVLKQGRSLKTLGAQEENENVRPLPVNKDPSNSHTKKRRQTIQTASRRAPPPQPRASQRARGCPPLTRKPTKKRQQSFENKYLTLGELEQFPKASQLNGWQYVDNAVTRTSLLPPVYPPHFTEQRFDASQVNNAGTLGLAPIYSGSAYGGIHSPHTNPTLSQFHTDLTPDLTQTLDFGAASMSSSPSLGSMRGNFETEDLRTLLNVDRVAYRLTERHVAALAVVLNLDVPYLCQVLDKILSLNTEILNLLYDGIKNLSEEEHSVMSPSSPPLITAYAVSEPPSASQQIQCSPNEAFRVRRHFASLQHSEIASTQSRI